MGLVHKVRILIGALAHKPFMPRPEKVSLDREADLIQGEVPSLHHLAREVAEPAVTDTERVADLIAQRQGDEAD